MSIQFFMRSDQFSTAAQLTEADMADVAKLGFKAVINNRPDGEGGPDQPAQRALEQAAIQAGLTYSYLPVVSGSVTMEQVQQFARILADAPKPVLAFCRSGARSAQLAQFASTL